MITRMPASSSAVGGSATGQVSIIKSGYCICKLVPLPFEGIS